MKILKFMKDGGPLSKVWGFWFIECKSLFSIALLKFENGSREAYHSHAFNSLSLVLKGKLKECHLSGSIETHSTFSIVKTYRETFHKVESVGNTYVLTFRGPWSTTWAEFIPESGKFITLTNGRKEI